MAELIHFPNSAPIINPEDGLRPIFRISGTLSELYGHNDVEIALFAHGRTAPIAPFHLAIENYSDIRDATARGRVQATINEYFAETEIMAVFNQLLARDYKKIVFERHDLPLDVGDGQDPECGPWAQMFDIVRWGVDEAPSWIPIVEAGKWDQNYSIAGIFDVSDQQFQG